MKARKNSKRETAAKKPPRRKATPRAAARKRAVSGAARVQRPAAKAHELRKDAQYGSGFDDRLEPLVPVDLSRVSSVSDLVESYGDAAIGARQVGEAADILHTMVRDPDCYVVCTVSGAMTVAKMGLVLCEMIEGGMVQAVVATGALMAHGFVEAAGLAHFKYDPSMDDAALFERGYNRVYDSLELEKNLDDVERIVTTVLDQHDEVTTWSSVQLNRVLGEWLSKKRAGRGILRSAYEHDVPVYVPAFTDSELGLDFALHSLRLKAQGLPRLAFDPFLDLDDYTQRIEAQKRTGIFTIGGGVPRNWAQQVGPYLEIRAKRAGVGTGYSRFRYAVRICPEPAHWGGLSGCTYSEGVSWGKFLPREKGGRYAEVYADATIVWPLVVQAVRERLRADASTRTARTRRAPGRSRTNRRKKRVRAAGR